MFMANRTQSDPAQTLKNAAKILLVDWPDPGVPAALLQAGFTVFGYTPGSYSVASLVANQPGAIKGQSIFPVQNGDEKAYLVFQKLDDRPDSVDIVNVYRPEEELAGIITNHVLPLKAKVLWLHPPVTSVRARDFATGHGLIFIDGTNIAEIATKI
jgi:predicted CoA-binding protein